MDLLLQIYLTDFNLRQNDHYHQVENEPEKADMPESPPREYEGSAGSGGISQNDHIIELDDNIGCIIGIIIGFNDPGFFNVIRNYRQKEIKHDEKDR